MIDTREELVNALTEAAELEHGLMLQYLFAALSLKKRGDEGLGPAEQELVRTWEGIILSVARDEMGHLGTVCNLLSAVGAAPRLGRPNFPQPAKKYYPFDFELTRFSDEALYRFVRAELPKGEPAPSPPKADRPPQAAAAFGLLAVVPEPIVYDYVGELYRAIETGFMTIKEQDLFIGPSFAQDTDDWARGMKLHLVKDRTSAKAAIGAIVLEGEGAPTNRGGSHYDPVHQDEAGVRRPSRLRPWPACREKPADARAPRRAVPGDAHHAF